MTFIPAFTTNAMTSDFLLLISHGGVVTFQDSNRTVFTFLIWLHLLGVLLAFWISIYKNLQITSKLLTQGYRYRKLRKTFGKFFRSYSEFLSKFGYISFQEYVSKGISHPVFYGDLVYKLRRVKDTPNFISSGSKIVKRLRRPFLKHCTLTNKAVGTILRALSKHFQRRQGPDRRPIRLLVGTPSAIRPELASRQAEHSPPYSDVTIYIFDMYM